MAHHARSWNSYPMMMSGDRNLRWGLHLGELNKAAAAINRSQNCTDCLNKIFARVAEVAYASGLNPDGRPRGFLESSNLS